MLLKYTSNAARACGLALAATLLGALPISSTNQAISAAPQGWPEHVRALYRVTFSGFEIGSFQFEANVGGKGYSLAGNAELSALLGAFSWTGATRSAGRVHGTKPKPAGYTFDFRSNQKAGMIKMGFNGNRVSAVTAIPSLSTASDTVPLQRHHLKNVLDPLSAVMALTRPAKGDNPCARRLPIFDGKQRFDLVLSYRRQEPISELQPSGQPGVVIVCGVRYVPIAGFRQTSQLEAMRKSNGIEISLRPVPDANLYVPHQISIPTIAGYAALTLSRVDIMTPKRQAIALVH